MRELLFFVCLFSGVGFSVDAREIKIGSKNFTESVILGEMARSLLAQSNFEVVHQKELGGTRLLWNAILSGEIDIYPDYSGTLIHEIFYQENIQSFRELQETIHKYGLRLLGPLGFSNSYALGMKKERAAELGIKALSDLKAFPQLIFAFSNEFMDRKEGWPGLKSFYRLPQKRVQGMDHDLAYRGIESGAIDITDLYTTDAEITHYGLVPLLDDRHYFPSYEALWLVRSDLIKVFPEVEEALSRLNGKISSDQMAELNAKAKIQKVSESKVATDFLNTSLGLKLEFVPESRWKKLKGYTVEHFRLVGISLFAAILLAIPLGILCAKFSVVGQMVLTLVSIIQTIPSLALLVFMIPLVGIGSKPAIVALFLYSLLPIVRNTYQGLISIPRGLIESAVVLGLPPMARLIKIELPLALGSILAGVKTSAVINIGTATLGALVGAGGFGQPILTGIRLDNVSLILLGAIPAAVFALCAQWGFDLLEKWLLPRGLRRS